MYATMQTSSASVFGSAKPNNLYRNIGLQTGVNSANSHQLVIMLFDGAMEAINRARGAIRNHDLDTKGKAIRKAVAIVDEGLKSCLNLEAGGELAHNLSNLYAYITTRLTQANLKSDESALEECVNLLTPIRDAWVAITPTSDAPASHAAMRIQA